MARGISGRARGVIATVAILAPVMGFVIWSSFQVSLHECEVCIDFRGRQNCRTVSAATQEEALRSATENACALLASGVTESLRCNRTPPTRASCREL